MEKTRKIYECIGDKIYNYLPYEKSKDLRYVIELENKVKELTRLKSMDLGSVLHQMVGGWY